MTIRRLIKQLLSYPNLDAQVVDTEGNPIMWSRYFSRDNDDVKLEPKSEMDIEAELDNFFEEVKHSTMSDNDVAQELKDMGYTLEDLREYNTDVYSWALLTNVEW